MHTLLWLTTHSFLSQTLDLVARAKERLRSWGASAAVVRALDDVTARVSEAQAVARFHA